MKILILNYIDKKNIKIKISLDVYPFESEIVFYNNGVIFIDSEEIFTIVDDIFGKIT